MGEVRVRVRREEREKEGGEGGGSRPLIPRLHDVQPFGNRLYCVNKQPVVKLV